MSGFLITLFVDNVVKEFELNSLIGNRSEVVLEREFLGSKFDLKLPFYKTGDRWMIQIFDDNEKKLLINGQEARADKQLEHGDYISVVDLVRDAQYTMIVSSLNLCAINFKKFKLEFGSTLFIGRKSECEISYINNNLVSRSHAMVQIEVDGTAFIKDDSSRLGVYVNGYKIDSHKLKVGDLIYIAGLKITYMKDYIAISNNYNSVSLEVFEQFHFSHPLEEVKKETSLFIRSPRILKSLESGVFEVDAPPSIQKRSKMPMILTIGPSLTMAIAMFASLGITLIQAASGASSTSIATSSVMAGSMLMGALLWPILTNRYQKQNELMEENHRKQSYMEYIGQLDTVLKEKYQRNTRILNEVLYPKPEEILNLLKNTEKERRLWERTAHDKDFLEVRLGKGERVFQVEIKTPRQGFNLYHDPLADEPIKLSEKYERLLDVPITISLKEQKNVGLIGKRKKIMNNAKCIALNLAGLHSYDEVKMVFIHHEKESKDFAWVYELPHVWSNDRSIRYIATNKDEVHKVFNAIDEVLKEREQREGNENNDKEPHLPSFVVFITCEKLVENEPLMRYIANPQNTVGVSSIFIYGDITKLPKDSDTIIQSDDSVSGIYYKNMFLNKFIKFSADEVVDDDLIDFSQRLSNYKIKTNNLSLSLPDRISFLEMYKVGNIDELRIERRWHENLAYKSLAVPIGIKAGGELFSLDVHENYHGPHGLVAGMTGSGKSEFLQAYIISAAINFHPHYLSFVLIDYKGGGMANCFDGMPHIAGKITNLSGSQLNRSLVSIRAELRRRQLMFYKLGINHIDKYQKMFKEGKTNIPLPHLLIISDEFAQLKTQQSEFMKELIDVAQIGRSLGIHLVLATQKPSGVVDAQIWSNSKFRVCLKVLDKCDSNEMINKPHAAMIKLPGRCYVQVGYDEVFEYIQSGYSGVEYLPTHAFFNEEERRISLIDSTASPLRIASEELIGQQSGISQLEAIIENIIDIAKVNNIAPLSLWLDPLKEVLELAEISDFGVTEFDEQNWSESDWKLLVSIGMVDLPKHQQQLPVEVNLLKDGHIVLYGTSGTDKTTFLQTLLYVFAHRYSPAVVNMYIFDFGSRTLGYFGELPHCGGVVYSDDAEKVTHIMGTLIDLMEQRKVLFSEKSVGSYEAYISTTNEKLPAVMLVVDDYSVFKEFFYRLEDIMIKLAANGKMYGIYLIITGNSKGSVSNKVIEHVSKFFVLKLNDNQHYRDILNVSVPLEPEDVKGRGLTIIDKVAAEFQVAIVKKTENEAERVSYIREQFAKMSMVWNGPKAFQCDYESHQLNNAEIMPSSEVIFNSEGSEKGVLKNTLTSTKVDEHTLYIGNLTANNSPLGVELKDLHTFFIGGLEKTGKTDMLKFLMSKTKEYPDRQLVLVDRITQELKSFAEHINVDRYISAAREFDDLVLDLTQVFMERKNEYEQIKATLGDDKEIYSYMLKFSKIFVYINGFADFFKMISDEALDQFTEIVANCKGLNLYFVTMDNFNMMKEFSVTEIYSQLVQTKKGVLMGGAVDKQHLFIFEEMGHQERQLVLNKGQGILFDTNKYAVVSLPA